MGIIERESSNWLSVGTLWWLNSLFSYAFRHTLKVPPPLFLSSSYSPMSHPMKKNIDINISLHFLFTEDPIIYYVLSSRLVFVALLYY